MKKEETQIRAIARLVALGFSVEMACKRFYIEDPKLIESWKRTAQGDLFKGIVRDFQEKIEADLIDDAVGDPEYHKLKVLRRKSWDRVEYEIDNFDREDEGATSSSRLTASKMAIAGSEPLKEDDDYKTIKLQLSESLLTKCLGTEGPREMPPQVTG